MGKKIILITAFLSLIVTMFVMNSTVMLNTNNAKLDEKISGTICEIIFSHGEDKFILSDQEKGYYFSLDKGRSEDSKKEVRRFIRNGSTRIVKESNSALVFYINGDDTLKVKYEIYEKNLALFNGLIVR
jgi:hypothetical protein